MQPESEFEPRNMLDQPDGEITAYNYNPFTHERVITTVEPAGLSDYEIMRNMHKNSTTTIELRPEAVEFIKRFYKQVIGE